MPTFEPGDLIRAPFPYRDRPVRRWRPAIVVAPNDDRGLIWAVMVTSAAHARWPGDIVIEDHSAAGLPAPSMIRTAKIATLDAANVERLGATPAPVCVALMLKLKERLDL